MKMHHATAVCRSEENADRFYQGVLGLEKTKRFVLDKSLTEQIFGIDSACQINLYANDNVAIEVFVADEVPKKRPSFLHLCLQVEDREPFLSMCQTKGLDVNRIQKGDSLLAFIRDYDGNLFEIKETAGTSEAG